MRTSSKMWFCIVMSVLFTVLVGISAWLSEQLEEPLLFYFITIPSIIALLVSIVFAFYFENRVDNEVFYY